MPNSNPALEKMRVFLYFYSVFFDKNVAWLKTNGNFLQYIIFKFWILIFWNIFSKSTQVYKLLFTTKKPNYINARLPTKDETVRYDCKEFILFVS